MNKLVTIVMALALLLLMVFSLAPFFGIDELTEPRHLSGGLGLTGIALLAISAIGGLVYWAGRK